MESSSGFLLHTQRLATGAATQLSTVAVTVDVDREPSVLCCLFEACVAGLIQDLRKDATTEKIGQGVLTPYASLIAAWQATTRTCMWLAPMRS